jgi:hypothetical protein
MNSMNVNDERFFDLAMKVIARQAGDAERAELDALLAREPELRAEFARLQADARVAKEALPLVKAMEATAGEFPAYARERLQTKVRRTLGRPEAPAKEPDRRLAWGWRWALGLAAAAALVVLLLVPTLTQSPKLVVQVAMLDVGGASRGINASDMAALPEVWKNTQPQTFSTSGEFEAWENRWPDGERATAKIIYDKAAGEIRVLGRWNGKPFQKTILVGDNLKTALELAKAFVREQTGQ